MLDTSPPQRLESSEESFQLPNIRIRKLQPYSSIAKTVPDRFGIDTFGVGMDTGLPVSNTYQPPFAFTGTIQEVRVELK